MCSLTSTRRIIKSIKIRKYTNTAQLYERNETQETQKRNKLSVSEPSV